MRRSGRLTAIVLVVVSLLLVAAGLLLLVRPDSIPERMVLVVDLREDLPEESRRGVLSSFLGRDLTVFEVVRALDAAAADERVEAINLRLGGVRCGLGRAQEVRRALAGVKEAGKPIVALMEGGGTIDSYLASVADEAYTLPGGSVMIGGLVMEIPFVRGSLDSLGIYPDFVTAGAEKDTPEVYTRTGASDVMRLNMTRVVTDLNDQISEDLASGRKLDRVVVDELSDRGFLTGAGAREAGIVDGTLHADGIKARLEHLIGEGVEEVPLRRYVRNLAPGWLENREIIALVHVGGVLVPGDSMDNAWYGRSTGARTLAATLRELGEDQNVAAVVLRLDTPGGSSEASEIIWREIRMITESKPVVVSMGDYAASGGYYIAVAADEILAEPATITGSIGVFAGKFALAGLYDLVGMNWEQARSGRNDDMFHDRLPWTEEQRELIREQITEVHGRFQEVIVTGRGLSAGQVAELATGRVYTGREALAHGLVDGLGGLPQAVLAARRRAGVDDDALVEVRIFPRGGGLLAGLTGGGSQATAPLPGPLGSLASDVALWELLAEERIAAFSPYRVVTP